MNTQSPFFPTLLRSSALFLVLVLASACSKTVKWKEEVQLSNGRVIIVERATQHRPGGSEWAIGTGWRPRQYLIRFKYPPGSDQVIEWRSIKMDVERGTEPEYPLLLDVGMEKNALHIISIRGLRGFCFEYVRYVISNGAWSEVPLPVEFEPRDATLYLPAAALDIPKQVSLTLKRKENADIRYSMRFKKIGPKQTDCKA